MGADSSRDDAPGGPRDSDRDGSSDGANDDTHNGTNRIGTMFGNSGCYDKNRRILCGSLSEEEVVLMITNTLPVADKLLFTRAKEGHIIQYATLSLRGAKSQDETSVIFPLVSRDNFFFLCVLYL